MTTPTPIERRAQPVEVQPAPSPSGRVIIWYPSVFNTPSEDLGGFREVVLPGAFSSTLKSGDVAALFNHDANNLLGRTKSGTLKLREDARGLRAELVLPRTTTGDTVLELARRSDLTAGSFAFSVVRETWGKMRELREVKLYDVSLATFPAYPATNGVEIRSLRAPLPGMPWQLAAAWRAAWLAAHEHVPLSAASRRAQLERLREPPERRGPRAWDLDTAPPRRDSFPW